MAEAAQAERERRDQEKAADNRKRQARQGIVPVEPEVQEEMAQPEAAQTKEEAKPEKSE